MTARIVATFQALVKCADFSGTSGQQVTAKVSKGDSEEEDEEEVQLTTKRGGQPRGLRPEFHYNIQIHLPNNATEEVYLNIFNALRKTFQ
jgi:hypothetical protein